MTFLNSILKNSKKYEFPFNHWEYNNALSEAAIKEIEGADIPDVSMHNLNYDGTRAIDGGAAEFREGIASGGKAIKFRCFVTKENASHFPNLVKFINELQSKENIINRGEIGIQGSRPAEVIKLWLGLRFLGLNGIENILKSSIKRKDFFIKNISKNKFDIYSGPLHIVSFIPKKLEPEDSDTWTQTKVNELINNNFMLSRPKFKGRYFLRVVMGNYNTKESHIEELLRLLNV